MVNIRISKTIRLNRQQILNLINSEICEPSEMIPDDATIETDNQGDVEDWEDATLVISWDDA